MEKPGGGDWEERPARSELEWCFVVGLLCSNIGWFVSVPGTGTPSPMIDFVVVSADLRPHVLDTRVKRGAELSTDHHLVVS